MELNRIFIEIYGLENELTPDVEEADVSIQVQSEKEIIKSLISYAIGCMFGRYDVKERGVSSIVYNSTHMRTDNIIPITDEEYFPDDIVSLFSLWLSDVFGNDVLDDNLAYIAGILDGKGSTVKEVLRLYFVNEFYKEHCLDYSIVGSGKRPIYWLFDAGKQNGFKALIYMHRYNADAIGNLRVDYLHRMERIYESEINRMQDTIDNSSNAREVTAATKRKEKLQKQLKECQEYDEKIGHLALSRIEIDLDDGVKVNYEKVQTANDGKKYQVLAKI